MQTSLKIFLAFLLMMSAAYSQKLPNKQGASVWAPANIKIDGKTTEWDNQFRAYNSATSLFYTISNNADNLYLTFRATDIDALIKITGAGIEFNVSVDGKKSDKNIISVTYPFFEGNKKPYLSFKNLPKIVSGSPTSVIKADSVMRVMNKRLDERSKFIKIIGIPGMDTLISVYNEEGIKAAEAFNNTMAYTCEIAISLKYLNLPVNNVSKFFYHILLPGLKLQDIGIVVQKDATGKILSVSSAPGSGDAIPSRDHLTAVYAITDFWGEYTLAKKP